MSRFSERMLFLIDVLFFTGIVLSSLSPPPPGFSPPPLLLAAGTKAHQKGFDRLMPVFAALPALLHCTAVGLCRVILCVLRSTRPL